MEVGDIRRYKERLKALDEIEKREQRALTVNENWLKLNALFGLGRTLGWKEYNVEEVEATRARWIKLKELYENMDNNNHPNT